MRDVLISIFLSVPLVGAFAIFALGISVIYRASRVLNLAHGAMAMLPAYVFYELSKAGVPIGVCLPIAIITGALLGVGVERFFVRRLRPQGATAQTVGTVAVGGLIIALSAKVFGTSAVIAPKIFPEGELRIAGAAVRWGDIGLFGVGLLVACALFAFFTLTDFGLAMRGAAENRRAAALMGVNPDIAAASAWALGGGLAALAGVLLAAVTTLDPYNLTLQVLPAFVAVLIGRLESMPGAVAGAAIAGLAFGLQPQMARIPGMGSILGAGGAPQLVLTVLALVVMALRGGRFSASSDEGAGSLSSTVAFRPARTRRISIPAIAGVGVLVLFPFIAPFSFLGDATLAMELAMVAASLVVLIGWVGQISLAQASFVGIGAFVTGMVTRGLGLGFPFSVLIGAVAAAAAAVLLGVVALRVRGLYLAVATLIFAWMADQFLFPSPWLGAQGGSSTIAGDKFGRSGAFPSFDLTSRKTLYFVLLAMLVIVVAGLSNLRDTKVGRAFFALRGSEVAATSLGIDVTRYKLVAFAVSGIVAGIGGGLLMVEQRTVVPAQFLFTVSLQYLAIAVVGGLTSLGGAMAAGVLFAALNELFFKVRFLAGWLEVVSAGLLALVLLAYPGGISAAAARIRRLWHVASDRRTARAGRRARVEESAMLIADPAGVAESLEQQPAELVAAADVPPAPMSAPSALRRFFSRDRRTQSEDIVEDWLANMHSPNGAAPATNGSTLTAGTNGSTHHPQEQLLLGSFPRGTNQLDPVRENRRPLVQAEGIVVQFGGLTAVKNASLEVREGEIVGLIGPNGAGKTTTFNAILGLNSPVAGSVRLYGRDVSGLPPHVRARLGVGRTFQVLQLFADLTVFDNLLVATHLHNRSSLASNLAASSATMVAETDARRRVAEVLRLLGLEDIGHETVRGLPFGILRMVELGRALVTGARVLMLDEIASGLNDAETQQLSRIIMDVRALGVSILLIEHDVRMVVSVSDYIYVLDQGQLIAEGPPAAIQRDPNVIAAYLGGDVQPHAEPGSESVPAVDATV